MCIISVDFVLKIRCYIYSKGWAIKFVSFLIRRTLGAPVYFGNLFLYALFVGALTYFTLALRPSGILTGSTSSNSNKTSLNITVATTVATAAATSIVVRIAIRTWI